MLSKKVLVPAILLSAIVVLAYACHTMKKSTLDCTTVEASYSKDIHPLVMARCMPCHKANSKHGDFTTYDGLKAVATSGDLRKHALRKMDMPPGPGDVPKNVTPGPLPEDARQKIACWLNNGAPNN